MSQMPSPDGATSESSSRRLSVDEICQKYQAELDAGRRPKIEKVLAQVKEKYHERLLRSLLTTEVSYRRRAGETPNSSEYRGRFPEYRTLVDEVFEFLGAEVSKELPSAVRRALPVSELLKQSSENTKSTIKPPPLPESAASATKVVAEGETRVGGKVAQKPGESVKPAVKPPPMPASKTPAQEAPSRKVATTPTHHDEDLETLLSVVVPQAPPKRKKTAEEMDEAKERHERRKERQKQKDRERRRLKVQGPEVVVDPRDIDPPEEFLLPMILLVVSGVLNLVTAAILVPAGIPALLYILFKIIFVLVSIVVTTGALYAAAAILGTHYGYLNTGLIKITAICLTQSWISDLAWWGPVPALFNIAAWATTYTLFQLFFDLEPMEVVSSMAIVRVIRGLSYAFIFVAFMQALAGVGAIVDRNDDVKLEFKPRVFNEAAVEASRKKAREELAKLEAEPEPKELPRIEIPVVDPEAPMQPLNQQDPTNVKQPDKAVLEALNTQSLKLAQRFSNHLILQDYDAAYQLTSKEYKNHASLEVFQNQFEMFFTILGLPLTIEPRVLSADPVEISRHPQFHTETIPDGTQMALVELKLTYDVPVGDGRDEEFDENFVEAVRNADNDRPKEGTMTLILVNEGGKGRVGIFEFEE